MIRRRVLSRASLALLALLSGTCAMPHLIGQASAAPAIVIVTGVATDNSSVKIDFQPVSGAKDYRIFDTSNPMMVKYAGMRHLDAGPFSHFAMQPDGVTPDFPYMMTPNWMGGSGPQTLDVPATEIEWNMMADEQPHVLVVQAVDALGPAPAANLYDDANAPLHQPTGMLGANEGVTLDGTMSINGEGSPTNMPRVIAQSQPFVAQANTSLRALPSRPDATQTFFDTFDSSENAALQRVGPTDARIGVMSYTLNAGTPQAWDILYQGADTDHSMPMVMDGHFMDVLFDGITPSSLPPGFSAGYHVQYSTMAMSPRPTADLSNGQLLHLTEEVDGHLDGTFRWLAWQLAPATDPLTTFKADNYLTSGFSPTANTLPVNHSDQALWLQMFAGFCDATLFEGPSAISSTAPLSNQFLTLHPGSVPPCRRTAHLGGNGNGLDNRERWDVFLTTRHLAIFEDGQMIVQSDIPDGGLPFDHAKLYFSHYLYATAEPYEPTTIRNSEPWETYWRDIAPHSDERHWDNMGFEVLPASDVPADWSSLAALIRLPASITPAFTAMPSATNTATPLPSATSTATPRPAATSTPTATPMSISTPTRTASPAHPIPPVATLASSSTPAPPTTIPAATATAVAAPTTPWLRPNGPTTPVPGVTSPRPHGRGAPKHQRQRGVPQSRRAAFIVRVMTTWLTRAAPGRSAVARITLRVRRSGTVPLIAFRLLNRRGAIVAQTRRRRVTFTAGKPPRIRGVLASATRPPVRTVAPASMGQ